jgi:serine/threonine protein kinase
VSVDRGIREETERLKPDNRVGTRIGEYELLQLIGVGSATTVYLAEHVRLKRRAAVKIFAPELARGPIGRRFTLAWEQLAKLEHPNIVLIYDAEEIGRVPYVAMRYVDGESLADMIERKGALDPMETLHVLDQAATALGFAHGQGIVHQNLKPQNILVTSGDDPIGAQHVYVSDFAIMKEPPGPLPLPPQAVEPPSYLSPEQLRGEPVDERSDVYALGLLLFEALTGTPTFADADRVANLNDPPPSAHERAPHLRAAIDGVLERALAQRKEDRFEKPADLVDAARDALARVRLILPQADGLEAPDTAPPSTAGQTLSLPTSQDAAAPADTTATTGFPAPSEQTVLVLPTTPDVDTGTPDEVPLGQESAPAGATDRRTFLFIGSLILAFALISGIASALSEEDDLRDVVPTAPPQVPSPSAGTDGGGTSPIGPTEPSVPPVQAPVNVAASVAPDAVRIEWEPPEGTPAVRFVVVRDGERVARVRRLFYVDSDVGPGERHVYRIVSVGRDGSTARSDRVITIATVAQEPVETPSGLVGEAPPSRPPPPQQQCDGLVVGDDCLA